LGAPLIAQCLGGNHWVHVLDSAALYVMLALGLNVMVGFAGLLDLGYIAFYAVGAYAAALLSSPHLSIHMAWLGQLLMNGHITSLGIIAIAMGLAAFFGVLFGAPALRLRGDYLALVTLGFGEIVRIFISNLDRPINLTNGPKGISDITTVKLGSVDFSQAHTFLGWQLSSLQLYYYLFLGLILLMVWICTRLRHSRIGRAWAAIREDEVAARAMGIETQKLKALAFSIGASFGGVAGAMFGAFQGFVSPESFTFGESVFVLSCVVLGGIGHLPGVILGAILLCLLPEFLRSSIGPLQQAYFGREVLSVDVLRQLIYGLTMIAVMLCRPSGLWPMPVSRGRLK
jgi:branched-chain amino acid transport system permease protein